MELLAPAGNRKALDAAIAAGADAIYLGYTAFSARSYAGNFDEKGLVDAVRAAHQMGRRIYVTVNTLVKEEELPELKEALAVIRDAGADAILVQDLGVLRVVRQHFPDLAVHASTQMTVNNVQGVELLRDLGIRRVVPARECRLAELQVMADTGVEIEAFVHGALCVCVSGQCLFSGMIGGRSGNRGKCSQPCRLPYTLSDGTHGYLLSPRDLMLISRVRELREAGIASLKIEGRMKSPEYVATVTDAYRRALDTPGPIPEQDLAGLRQIFNRGGFTEGYVFSQNHRALMSWEKPNHQGIQAGTVTGVSGKRVTMMAEMDIDPGDMFQIRSGSREQETVYSGPAVRKGHSFTLSIEKEPPRPGDRIWRLVSVRLNERARAFRPTERPRIPVQAKLEAVPGTPAILTLTDPQGRTGQAQATTPTQPAETNALTVEGIRKILGKLRETPYTLAGVELIGTGAFLPVSELNALRRAAISSLMQVDRAEAIRIVEPVLPARESGLIAVTENPEEAEQMLAAGADQVAWYPRDYRISSLEDMADRLKVPVIFVLPQVTETAELETLAEFVGHFRDKFRAVQVNNIGQIHVGWPVPMTGGQGLNVMNSECAKMLTQLGLSRLTVSCELNAGEIRRLLEAGGNYELECYGRVQLMLLSHCPKRTKAGDRHTDGNCNACEASDGWCETLRDRKGMNFPLRRIKMQDRCQISLYNSVVTDMARHGRVLRSLNCMWRLLFTDESPDMRLRIIRNYRQLMDTGDLPDPLPAGTGGHLMRGVE
ncbi:MAG: U32 family peptidase [Clostridia bacterium]|nr:U32 family peptidase [Clostridia bacterium]